MQKTVVCSKDVRDGQAAEPLLNPNPFALAKEVKRRIRQCAGDEGSGSCNDLTYLWARVSSSGIGRTAESPPSAHIPTLDEWLNVVDEAAALGATWFIVRLSDSLSSFPDIWTICQWAQDTHSMTVGLHIDAESLSEADVAQIRQLDTEKTRLVVARERLETMRHIEEEQGVKLWVANPQAEGETPNCQGPGRMLFVDGQGVLYTCGLVEGNDDYRLGNVFEDEFQRMLTDPALPHKVCKPIWRVSSGCDGCPSLVANYVDETAVSGDSGASPQT